MVTAVQDKDAEADLMAGVRKGALAPLIDRVEFARMTKYGIKSKGLTYKAVSEMLNSAVPGAKVSDVSIWSYAQGKAAPRRLWVYKALEEVLEISYDRLFVRRDDDAAPPEGSDVTDDRVMVRDVGGRAEMRIKVCVPWPTALKILDLIKSDEEG